MKESTGSQSGPQIDLDRWRNEGGAGDGVEPASSDVNVARVRVNTEFDRLSRSIAAGTERNAGLLAGEIVRLLELVEEKRSEELALRMSMERIKSWQWTGRAQSILVADPRAALVYKARDQRRLAAGNAPVRYFGFVDRGGFRVFNFGRLPETKLSPRFRVRVSLAFFSRNGMALQDGPGFSAAILSRCEEPNDCEPTLEDVDRFLATRAPRSADKVRTVSRTPSQYDGR